jgi:hypothetical protein
VAYVIIVQENKVKEGIKSLFKNLPYKLCQALLIEMLSVGVLLPEKPTAIYPLRNHSK